MSRTPEAEGAAAVEAAAVRLLAMREHGRQELRRKLARRFGQDDSLDEVLDALERQRLLSDERFVEAYVAQRSRKGYGPLRIRAELAERGAPGDLVEQLLEAAGVDWPELISEVAQRKFGGQPAEDRAALAKRGRFLEQRGFPISLVRRYLDGVSRS